jgi:hypothetical protein
MRKRATLRTSLNDPGLWYAVRSRISVMGFLCAFGTVVG